MKNIDLLISHWYVLFQIINKKYVFIKCIIISKSWVNVFMFQNNFYENYLSEKNNEIMGLQLCRSDI